MACGNNKVSRADLKSKPMPLSRHLATLFDRSSPARKPEGTGRGRPLNNETEAAQTDKKITITDTRGREKDVWQKYSAGAGKEQSLNNGAKTVDESRRSELWKLASEEEPDGTSELDRTVTVHRYLDSNRNETLNAQLHIHEILRPDGTVSMHVTDRRDGGAAKQVAAEVFLRPVSGNEVNAAEARLASIMREMEE